MNKSVDQWDRREFLGRMALAGAAGLVGLRRGRADADPPPETTRLRLFESPFPSCVAPLYVAQELLYSEGFTDVRYVKWPSETKAWPPEVLLSGQVDICLSFGPKDVLAIEAGAPLAVLAGSHIGCVELVGSDRVRSTRELKGKNVALYEGVGDDHVFISMFAAHVGLDPQKDINWVLLPIPADSWEAARLLAAGKIDAFFVGPPDALEMRAKKIGHVLVNTTTDKPWSQYFCCLVASTKEFVLKHPWRPNARCEPFSSPLTCAPSNQNESSGPWWKEVGPRATTMPCRVSRRSRTASGASTIPRTRCASTRYDCATSA